MKAANLIGKMGIYEQKSTMPEGLYLGHELKFTDGRVFRLCKNGAANLASGKLVIRPDDVANHLSMTPTAAAIGLKKVTVTLGATAATANQYKDGYLKLETGTQYKVKSHPAADASATLELTLYDGLWEAIAGTETCDLVANIYTGTVISATDQADLPLGVPMIDVTAAYYYWLQTRGPAMALMDENAGRGDTMTIGTSVAGALEVQDLIAEPIVGHMIQAGVDTEFSQIFLQCE